MTLAKECKDAGLPSAAYLCEVTDKDRWTLDRWRREQPKLFGVVLAGALSKYGYENDEIHNGGCDDEQN